MRSKCLWFCREENFSSRCFRIFGLKVLGATSGILQEETDLFQTQLLPFLRKFMDSGHWLHAPNILPRTLDQGYHWLMLNFVRVTMIAPISKASTATLQAVIKFRLLKADFIILSLSLQLKVIKTSETYSQNLNPLTKEIICLYCWKATLNLKRYFTLRCGSLSSKRSILPLGQGLLAK